MYLKPIALVLVLLTGSASAAKLKATQRLDEPNGQAPLTLRLKGGALLPSEVPQTDMMPAFGADIELPVGKNVALGMNFLLGNEKGTTLTMFGLTPSYQIQRGPVTVSVGATIARISAAGDVRYSPTEAIEFDHSKLAIGLKGSFDLTIVGPFGMSLIGEVLHGLGDESFGLAGLNAAFTFRI